MNTKQKILFVQKQIQEKKDELDELEREAERLIKLSQKEDKHSAIPDINIFLNNYKIINKDEYKMKSNNGKSFCRIVNTELYNNYIEKKKFKKVDKKFFYKIINNKVEKIKSNGNNCYLLQKKDTLHKKCDKCGFTLSGDNHTDKRCKEIQDMKITLGI
tara:strand:- start:292 stop:768 length:477 start_codon:yes stop_codon:yes gene_type:complete